VIRNGLSLLPGLVLLTEDLYLRVFTALPRLTARRAITIEPTIQEPISKVRALKKRLTSSSTILSSIRESFCL
jgi:hypothetical protein